MVAAASVGLWAAAGCWGPTAPPPGDGPGVAGLGAAQQQHLAIGSSEARDGIRGYHLPGVLPWLALRFAC